MNELIAIDPSFNEGMFITKVNNIFVMLHSAVMMDDIDRVRHFLSEPLEKLYEDKIKKLNDDNVRQMYDELNVKTSHITNISVLDDKIIINVDIVSRYMDYLVNKTTNEFISGFNDHRIEKMNHLTLEKQRGAAYKKIAQSCPGCGANIDVNNSGKCPYCGAIFDTEKYDWVLTSIETVDV